MINNEDDYPGNTFGMEDQDRISELMHRLEHYDEIRKKKRKLPLDRYAAMNGEAPVEG